MVGKGQALCGFSHPQFHSASSRFPGPKPDVKAGFLDTPSAMQLDEWDSSNFHMLTFGIILDSPCLIQFWVLGDKGQVMGIHGFLGVLTFVILHVGIAMSMDVSAERDVSTARLLRAMFFWVCSVESF